MTNASITASKERQNELTNMMEVWRNIAQNVWKESIGRIKNHGKREQENTTEDVRWSGDDETE